jgi:hypothetical protein
MKPEQQRRYDKIYSEQFNIIDHKFIKTKNTTLFYEFIIAGNRGFLYKVSLHNNGLSFCNCPDFYEHAIRNTIICKHICFIFVNFFKYTDPDIFNTTIFNVNKVKTLLKIQKTNNKPNFNKYKILSDTDECSICFSIFTKEEKIVGCPNCLNAIHLKCINNWLDHKKTCPICRSDIWKKFDYK